MNNSVSRVVPLAAFGGLVAVVLSLPLLFLVHRTLGLGNPPVSGLVLLGGTVIICFALAGALGASLGSAGSNALVAALLGLVLGGTACFVVAPFYAGLVMDGFTHDATGMVWNERGRILDAARGVANGRAGEALTAAREGRLRQQLSETQKQASEANTPQAREQALKRAKELAGQLATEGGQKAVVLLKAGAARTSAFALLLWVLVGPPAIAALSCRRGRN